MMVDDSDMMILEFSEDISDAEAPEPLPIGDYRGTIEGVDVRVSQTDRKYVAVTFRVSPDEFPADYPLENSPDGKMLTYRRVPAEDDKQSRYRLRQFCEAIGAAMAKQINPTEWIGLEAVLTVEHDSYEGVIRENVVRVNAV